ncbi:hypothetical protein MMC14_001521 [Varicellaria rhodocarpa]|nr:hypothetical protein [Varicellaria rhodocarpa]
MNGQQDASTARGGYGEGIGSDEGDDPIQAGDILETPSDEGGEEEVTKEVAEGGIGESSINTDSRLRLLEQERD